MTDMSQSYTPQYGAQDDDAIVLSLGEGTTGGLASNLYAPPPEGTHRWQVVKIERQYTKDSEIMVNVDCQVVESHTPGAVGMTHTERLVIPGALRFQQDHESWEKMMRFLRLKLEGITGRPWRTDNIQLSPNRDLMGCVFIARCYHQQSEPQVQADGSSRTYVNSKLADWTSPGIPAGAPNPAQGTLVGQTPAPTLGQVMQPQQAPPTINPGAQAPPQTLDEAAARMAAPAQPNPLAGVMVQPEPQSIMPSDVQTVPASMLQPQQQPAPQQPEQPNQSIGFGGMTFPTNQTAPENGGNGQPAQEPPAQS